MPAEETPVLMHFFTYNVHTILNPQERISVVEFNDGIPALLKRKQYTEIAGMPEHIKLYTSSITSDKYLVTVHAAGYTFIWYIHDDESLYAWRQQYERMPVAFFPQRCLPPAPQPPKQEVIPMNLNVLRSRI